MPFLVRASYLQVYICDWQEKDEKKHHWAREDAPLVFCCISPQLRCSNEESKLLFFKLLFLISNFRFKYFTTPPSQWCVSSLMLRAFKYTCGWREKHEKDITEHERTHRLYFIVFHLTTTLLQWRFFFLVLSFCFWCQTFVLGIYAGGKPKKSKSHKSTRRSTFCILLCFASQLHYSKEEVSIPFSFKLLFLMSNFHFRHL